MVKIGLIVLGILAIFAVGYKVVSPTSKTVVGKGGKVINLNTEKPSIPLGGCSISRLNAKMYWENGFKIQD